MSEKTNFSELWGLGLGIFLALYAGFLDFLTPKEPALDNHSGFQSTLLGLEMAETPKQVQDLVGLPDTVEYLNFTNQYKRVHYFDFGFIFCYLAFLTYTGHYAGRKVRPIFLKIFMGMVLLLILASFADIIENILILEVLDAKATEEMLAPLEYLRPTSQLKWFCLFFYVTMTSVYFWLYERSWLLRGASFLFTSGFFIQVFSILKINLLELSFPFFFFGLLLTWFHYGFSFAFSSLSKKT